MADNASHALASSATVNPTFNIEDEVVVIRNGWIPKKRRRRCWLTLECARILDLRSSASVASEMSHHEYNEVAVVDSLQNKSRYMCVVVVVLVRNRGIDARRRMSK